MKTLLKILALLTILGCKKESPTQQISHAPPTVESVSPNPARPGDVLTIQGQHFESDVWRNVLSLGSISIPVDSGSSTVLFSRLPFAVESSDLVFRTSKDTIIGPHITIERMCDALVCLSSYYGQSIADSLSWEPDCQGVSEHWSAQTSADTVALTLYYCIGDDSAERRTIRFRHLGNGVLPQYLSGQIDHKDGVFLRSDTLKGYIAIENWTIPGKLTGRVSAYEDSKQAWFDFNFYAVLN